MDQLNENNFQLKNQLRNRKWKAPKFSNVPINYLKRNVSFKILVWLKSFFKSCRKKNSFTISPQSDCQLLLYGITSFVVYLNLLVVPAEIAFTGKRQALAVTVYNCLTDLWLLLDMFFSLHTGYLDSNDAAVLDIRKIRKRYIRSWFAFDFISSIPFDLMIRVAVDSTTNYTTPRQVLFLRLLKILALFRLGRSTKKIRAEEKWESFFHVSYDTAWSAVRFTYMFGILFLVIHWNACIQYIVPSYNDFPKDSWVTLQNLHHPNVTWFEAYSWSLFKSTSHMLGIGYSQTPPVNDLDKRTTIFSQVTGAIAFALFTGSTIALRQYMNALESSYHMKMCQIQEFLAYRGIPIDLRKRVLHYFKARYRGKLFDEDEILQELSPNLRQKIIWLNTSSLLQSVPFFIDASDEFIKALGPALKFVCYQTDDVIYNEGDRATTMYFVCYGELIEKVRQTSQLEVLTDGMHFGETAIILKGMKRTTSVKALTQVDMYSLSQADFEKVANEFPKDKILVKTAFSKMKSRSNSFWSPRELIQESSD